MISQWKLDVCVTNIKDSKIYLKHEPFKEIKRISTPNVVFQSINQFLFQIMERIDVDKGFECLFLLSEKFWKIQDSVGSLKTSRNTKPTRLGAQDLPRDKSRRRTPPQAPHPRGLRGLSAITLCPGSSWNAVTIPGPFWIQGQGLVFLYQRLFSCFVWPPNREKPP